MLTATKKVIRVGASSRAIVLPSLWFNLMGSDIVTLEFDERTKTLVVYPVTSRAPIYDAETDFTPILKEKYDPSPIAGISGAKWAKLPPVIQKTHLDNLKIKNTASSYEEAQIPKYITSVSHASAEAYQGLKSVLAQQGWDDVMDIFNSICVELHNAILDSRGDYKHLFYVYGRKYGELYRAHMDSLDDI